MLADLRKDARRSAIALKISSFLLVEVSQFKLWLLGESLKNQYSSCRCSTCCRFSISLNLWPWLSFHLSTKEQKRFFIIPFKLPLALRAAPSMTSLDVGEWHLREPERRECWAPTAHTAIPVFAWKIRFPSASGARRKLKWNACMTLIIWLLCFLRNNF